MRATWYQRFSPHALAASLCAGLVLALGARLPFATAVAAATIAIAGLACSREVRLVFLAVALCLSGWWWASLRLEALDASALSGELGHADSAEVVVTGPVRRGRFALRMPAEVRRFGRRRVHEPVLLELPLGRSPPQGGILHADTLLRRPRERVPGSTFDERRWLQHQGVQVVMVGETWRLVGRRGGVPGIADELRAWLLRSLDRGTTRERRAVIAGVVLGADEGLSEDLRDAFRASGLYHLLAVSGQNVALLAWGILGLAWLLGIPRLLAHVGVLGAIAAYVLAVGLQPSVVRAGIAGTLTSLAWLAARQRDRWYFLLVGAAALLAWNPYNLLEPGFQLSFVAVAGIFVVTPSLQRRLEGYPLPGWAVTGLALTLGAGLATVPIVWLQFRSLPVFSVLANVAAEPAVGPLLGLALVAGVLEPVAPGAAAVLVWIDGWLAAYLAGCARAVARLPYAQVTSAHVLTLLAGGVALAVVLTRLRPPRVARALVVTSVVAALLLAWRSHSRTPPAPPPAGLRITFLDVGQGDSELIEVPEGSVLVDQGPPEADVAGQLRRLGLRRLSLVVLTHPQRDHVGGAAEVLERLRVGLVLDPRLPFRSWNEHEALRVARERGVPVAVARQGRAYRLGRLRIRVLWPDGPGAPQDDPNNHATVLLVSYGDVDALLTADAESDVTVPLHPPAVEILKVAHHGSADARLADLLSLTRPRVAVISVGEHNFYGHPTASTITTLQSRHGLKLLRTDEDGRIVVESDGTRLWVRSER